VLCAKLLAKLTSINAIDNTAVFISLWVLGKGKGSNAQKLKVVDAKALGINVK
jgi:hypothetical protein